MMEFDVKPVRLAILGLGTVGGGVLKLLQENAAEIKRRTGREIQITHVGIRRPHPELNLDGIAQSADLLDIVRQPDVDIVVEVMGGIHTANEVILEAIKHGKQVVTANKHYWLSTVTNYSRQLMIMRYKLPMKLLLPVVFPLSK
jgi:homoserine dehydrogenase (EC 1.1.1.3)